MQPIDFSRITFAELQATLNESRTRVHRAWLAHGPGTTREIAQKAQIDILSLRPRSTELYELGLIELLSLKPSDASNYSHQGIYRARTLAEWETYVTARRVPSNPQLPLKI